MSEQAIRSWVYKSLAERLPDKEYLIWPLDDFISNALAILYPYVRAKRIKSSEKLQLLIEAIKLIRKYKKESTLLDSLTEESLIIAIKDRWIKKISNKEELAQTIFFVDHIEPDERVYLNEKYKNCLNLSFRLEKEEFGDNNYIISTTKSSEQRDSTASIKVKKHTRKIDNEDVEMIERMHALNSYWDNIKLPEMLEEGRFFWEYKITDSQYQELKQKLIDLELGAHLSKFLKNNERLAFQIAFYLSEWFKREYNGNSQGDETFENGLTAIGLNTQSSGRIWTDAGLPESNLLKSSQNEFLSSMYVLGGLPIQYVTGSARFRNLIETVREKLYDDEEEDLSYNFSEDFDGRNLVYQESLQEGRSWYEYLKACFEEEIPIAEDDEKIEPFQSFIEWMKNGLIPDTSKFFSPLWNVEYFSESEIETFLQVSIAKRNNAYIPVRFMNHWLGNKADTLEGFCIGLESDKGHKSYNTIRFSKSGNYYFGWGTSWNLRLHFNLGEISSIKVVIYNLSDKDRKDGIELNSFEIPEVWNLSNNDYPLSWVKGRKLDIAKANFTKALLFNKEDFYIDKTVRNEDNQFKTLFTDKSNHWTLVKIYGSISLKNRDNDSTYKFYSAEGKLLPKFKKQSGIQYEAEEKVKVIRISEDEESTEYVNLLVGIGGLKEVYFISEKGETEKVKKKDRTIEYKQKGTRNYMPFDEAHIPECGMLKLKISKKNHSIIQNSIIQNCFFIPSKKNKWLKREIKNKIIQFEENLPIWCIDKDSSEDENKIYLSFGDFIRSNNHTFYASADLNKDNDTMPFLIDDGEDFLKINVYLADNCKEIYFDNKLLTKREESPVSTVRIPVILKDKFQLRIIDKNGVRRVEPGRNIVIPHNLAANQDVINNRLSGSKTMEEENAEFYLYENKQGELQRGQIAISSKHKDDYEFYYWNFKPEEAPAKLECKYDEGEGVLTIPLKSLDDNPRQGIIFQSLKDKVPPNYVYPYYPKYIGLKIEELKNDFDVLFSCIRIASEHKIYYSQFYPVRQFIEENREYKSNALFGFALSYMAKHNSAEDFIAMHRLAKEFLFDWLLLPKLSAVFWNKREDTEGDRKLMEKLFLSNPYIDSDVERAYLEKIIKLYWELPSRFKRNSKWKSMWKFSHNNTLINKAMQCMRGIDGDFNLVTDMLNYNEDKVKFLENIRTETFYKNLFDTIYKTINPN